MSITQLKIPRKALLRDMTAGLVMSIITVPGSIANGILAGINPIFGLYSTIVGTTVGAFFHQFRNYECRYYRGNRPGCG